MPAPPKNETLETQEERSVGSRELGARGDVGAFVAGVVVVFASGRAGAVPVPLINGRLELGREGLARLLADDDRISRQHLAIEHAPARGDADDVWVVRDLASRNGVNVDGVKVDGEVRVHAPRVVRVGRTIVLPVRDVRPFDASADAGAPAASAAVGLPNAVAGPVLRAAWRKIARAAEYGESLLVVGESGAGKELAARVFHAAATPSGPFVAVNCAAIPEGLAERLIFGAKKGAYSGATEDADGYLQSADGGTLFLDEVAELDLAVQGKLLRVLETHEVVMLGASRARKVNVRICSATHKDLRDEVNRGRFREDLFFRIGRPEITLPPLRERLDEIPALIARELSALREPCTPHVSLVEACLRRVWPGNVRELRAEVRRAAHDALGDGQAIVDAGHLGERAGQALRSVSLPPVLVLPPNTPVPTATAAILTHEAVDAALAAEGGNVTKAAKALGVHRTQLRRWLAKNGGGADDDGNA